MSKQNETVSRLLRKKISDEFRRNGIDIEQWSIIFCRNLQKNFLLLIKFWKIFACMWRSSINVYSWLDTKNMSAIYLYIFYIAPTS